MTASQALWEALPCPALPCPAPLNDLRQNITWTHLVNHVQRMTHGEIRRVMSMRAFSLNDSMAQAQGSDRPLKGLWPAP
jgi:hypothetical protein